MIEVVSWDVSNIALGFVPPVEIKGQILSEVPGLDRSGLIANLLAEGCVDKLAHVSSDGSFVFANVRPDIYQFSIGYHLGAPAGTYLKSIQVDGGESQTPTVDVTTGAHQLTAIFASDWTSLHGIVTDAQGRPVRATVYFVHEGGAPSYRGAPTSVRSDNSGRFTVASVPGDYRAFAFPLPANPMESDPEFRASSSISPRCSMLSQA
jgi:hypothetical protein